MAARNLENPVGKVYGRLTVIGTTLKNKRRAYLCRCECGIEKAINPSDLKRGRTVSCGCYHSERLSADRTKHGKSRSLIYARWCGIIRRCYDQGHQHYKPYGGRGISVCDRWRHSFENFYADMGDAPARMSIDRINNDGNYEPGNCRWATQKEQTRNTRRNRIIVIGEISKTVADWSLEPGVHYLTIWSRLKKGMAAIDAVFSKPQSAGSRSNFLQNAHLDRSS